MYRFEALNVSLELIRLLAPVLPRIRETNPDLADQLRRAATSASSCIAEGRRRTGKDRVHLFRIAEGSAAEVHTQLQIALAFGDAEPGAIESISAVADRLVGLCYGLTRVRADHVQGP